MTFVFVVIVFLYTRVTKTIYSKNMLINIFISVLELDPLNLLFAIKT